MKKLLLVSLCFLLLCVTQVFAQNRTITGTVTAKEDGLPIPGASVRIKGATVGVQTNVAGKFTLTVSGDQTIIVSFIGYNTETIKLGAKNVIDVALLTNSKQLGEVVVTGALGIKHQARETGYASTNVDNKTLTESHPDNLANGLSGKVAGLVITTYDNGINPNVGFTLRGNRHITGNNFALVILNGVPVSPDIVNNLNPEDVASVDVLNGSGAAALYGSEASNGALIITTRHGSSNGAPVINYSNTFQLEQISYFPALQRSFGSGSSETALGVPPFTQFIDPVTGFNLNPVPFENQSYGPAFTGKLTQLGIPLEDGTVQKYPYSSTGEDPRKAFFNTGHSEQNNISYSSGDEKNNFTFSANSLNKTGVVPNDSYDRIMVRIGATKTYGIFRLEFNAGYTQSHISTYANGYDFAGLNGGSALYYNILQTPAWVPLEKFKDQSAPFSDPSTYYNAYSSNPYWTVDNSRQNTRVDQFNGNFLASITPTKWFDASYRLADNFGTSQYQYTRQQVDFTPYGQSDPYGASSEAGTLGGVTGSIPGQVQNITQFGDGSYGNGVYTGAPAGPLGYARLQQDITLNFHKTFFNDFKTNLLLGNSIWQENFQQISNSSSSLLIKDFYNIGSIQGVPTTGQVEATIRQIGYFGAFNIGYKNFAFLEVTERNDHDSRLGSANSSFFYPSVKGSFVFTDAITALKNNNIISYGKLRASVSQVGEVNTSPYTINPTYSPASGFPYGSIGGLGLSTTLNNPTLKPEKTNETEVGADLGFFNNRISASVTYYDSHTKNQTLPITISPSTGYNASYLNIGEVQNTGWEFTLSGQVLTKEQNKVGLTLSGNLAIANSKVISLANGLPELYLGGFSGTAGSYAIVGKPFPYLKATDINRDPAGHPIVGADDGLPTLNSTLQPMGSLAPKYTLGLTQAVSYKFVTLTLTSEFRTGSVIYNDGEGAAVTAGTAQLSVTNGRQRFVFPNSVIQTGTNTYTPNTNVSTNDGNLNFWNSSAYSQAASTYVSSGAFWKLREANLSFDLTSFVRKSKFIKKASFALVGRNLLMFRPKSNNWTDPEFSGLTGATGGLNDLGELPPTRLYGANLNITF